jgi:hypothetical protein
VAGLALKSVIAGPLPDPPPSPPLSPQAGINIRDKEQMNNISEQIDLFIFSNSLRGDQLNELKKIDKINKL